ncbi:hypothetical protein TanjilG_19852 [Lupinus angustifolius]|uniref:Late embryogenesis abundant protein LEA-2 subgroup domain-containing protein n=1 Tax=Lupinus angustifolius TaxID=3871 RepID=A0A1J7HY59_LUPAN|nr:PREDICTED: uncharacterized protein LOC109337006 [Lupinus angustifolius]XP_019429521.1 PREDICTED: uncharacterized protein LOC109337070 [Lupinus angustifolius]XP_019429622.1 PREDICTED: uncharacterized protein LOC109337142 [Lupinus angustifolius]OIW17881.1 hypothetical protein TanjilG_19850 [Lupinus angustifolius]OIW17882.1 hypothetical protein TanjilG_19851 [Lupinus angustifolius]OIW17883.1 hypothetical protein TanjilG_19852 [Lupinus angustifolius]
MEGQTPQNGTTIKEVRDDQAVSSPVRLLPPPGHLDNHEMYIVQFPKDQIYRIPPRENALIVERHRNLPKEKKARSCCCSTRLLLTLCLILITIIAIVGITLAVLYFIFNPMGPTFSINDVMVNTIGKSKTPQYEISLGVKNPNNRLGLDYENNDNVVTLMSEGIMVATGKFPALEQGHDASSKVMVELTGTNVPLPKVMDMSMNDVKSNKPISLSLNMKLGLRVVTAGLKAWVMKSDVVCEFKVNALRNDTKILSQICETNFKIMFKII